MTDATGVRTYKILFRNGATIEFHAAWDHLLGGGYRPGDLISHWENCNANGVVPKPETAYRLPNANEGGPNRVAAVTLEVDITEIVAITQIHLVL